MAKKQNPRKWLFILDIKEFLKTSYIILNSI